MLIHSPEADQAEIDSLVARFYGVFDNRPGASPNVQAFVALFGPQGLLVSHPDAGPHISTPSEFVAPRVALLQSGRWVDFHEWETESQTELNRTAAVRRSRYQKRGKLEGRPYSGTGTKFFQLANLPEGWRIMAVTWIDDPQPTKD